jgi:hypothetical protein
MERMEQPDQLAQQALQAQTELTVRRAQLVHKELLVLTV